MQDPLILIKNNLNVGSGSEKIHVGFATLGNGLPKLNVVCQKNM
jgi:hypothetical protein